MTEPQGRAQVRASHLAEVRKAQDDLRRAMVQTQGVLDEYSSISPSDGDLALDRALKLQHQALDKYVGMRRSVTKSMLESALPDNGRFGKFFQDIGPHRTEELNLRAIVQASDDAIVGKTLNGTIMSWNKGAEKIYGYKAEEILGQPISVLIPPGHPNELPEIMVRLQRGDHIESFVTTRMHKDGHFIDVSITISPVKSKSGMVVGASVVARDITERKRAEAALRLSEERFRVALKGAPVVVFTQDLQLRYTWIHSPVLAWENQSIGHTDAEIVGGEEGARLTAIKQNVLRTGVGSRTEISVTFEGVMHYFDLVMEPLRDAAGTLIGLICSATDITSSKNVIAKLQEVLNEVRLLSGLLPICASCKKIKDEREVWQPLEGYIQAHSEAKFSHGMCPDCLRKHYPDFYT